MNNSNPCDFTLFIIQALQEATFFYPAILALHLNIWLFVLVRCGRDQNLIGQILDSPKCRNDYGQVSIWAVIR